MQNSKTILVAPLNWGLGHATRCIPLIRLLLEDGFKVLLASDGASLTLLKKEFPDLESIKLPPYHIEYAKNAHYLKIKLFLRSPKIIRAIKEERKLLKKLVAEKKVQAVLSDNRLGLYHEAIPCVYMTHQLQVLSGTTTRITSALHKRYIKQFDTCWVPDYEGKNNLSGVLGHPKNWGFPLKYIGPLSRLKKVEISPTYDILVLLSGPEPQRSILEELLLYELNHYKGSVLFVRGVVDEKPKLKREKHIHIVNYMVSEELEKVINASELIISRPGYTTIMDLAQLRKKAFFIPTPGQTEQEYLAYRLKKQGIAPFAKQDDFQLKNLSQVSLYTGFKASVHDRLVDKVFPGELFSLFKGKRKLRSYAKVAFYVNLLVVGLYNMFHNR